MPKRGQPAVAKHPWRRNLTTGKLPSRWRAPAPTPRLCLNCGQDEPSHTVGHVGELYPPCPVRPRRKLPEKKPHPSHRMTRWTTDVRAPAGTPRFYSVRKCRKCEGEEMKHNAGHFIEELCKPCPFGSRLPAKVVK